MNIEEYIPTGKKNAVNMDALVKLTGCKNSRTVRVQITQARKRGALICSTMSGTGGYYFAGTEAELREYVESVERRTRNTFFVLKAARAALKNVEGQISLSECDDLN